MNIKLVREQHLQEIRFKVSIVLSFFFLILIKANDGYRGKTYCGFGTRPGRGLSLHCTEHSQPLPATGHVRNLSNGAVEILLQGPSETIDNCIRDLQDSFAGCISQTDVDVVTPDLNLTDFRITF